MGLKFLNTGLKLLTVVALFATNSASAQNLITVDVSGGSFTPATITIDMGDTVRWTNTSGSHNVNGTNVTYPSNPESFGNAVAGPGWVFDFVFTMTGTYDYQCDIHVLGGMVGVVTVVSPAGFDDQLIEDVNALSNVYPTPASDYVVIELVEEFLSLNDNVQIVVFDLLGKEVLRDDVQNSKLKIDTENWNKAIYEFQLISGSKTIDTGRIIIQ